MALPGIRLSAKPVNTSVYLLIIVGEVTFTLVVMTAMTSCKRWTEKEISESIMLWFKLVRHQQRCHIISTDCAIVTDVLLRILLLCKRILKNWVSSLRMKWTAYSVRYGCIPWTGRIMSATPQQASCKESVVEWSNILVYMLCWTFRPTRIEQ